MPDVEFQDQDTFVRNILCGVLSTSARSSETCRGGCEADAVGTESTFTEVRQVCTRLAVPEPRPRQLGYDLVYEQLYKRCRQASGFRLH